MRWGPRNCFCIDDLYTTALGDWKSTEIEEKFFGPIDKNGRSSIKYFSDFEHPSANQRMFSDLLRYMSTQKLRTPKGLANVAFIAGTSDKNATLFTVQRLRDMFCAIWTECVWSIVDASESKTKFLLSDHPITVYNKACFPGSKHCRGHNDPAIWLTGTHTIFPLSMNKSLVLTNLSWLRNPYDNPLKERPHSELLRNAIFKFTDIKVGRKLSEQEVIEINYIVKRRAYRYVASMKEEWLYPEREIGDKRWNQLGQGYLLMPDPRSVVFSDQIIAGNNDGIVYASDEYGRTPGHPGYLDERRRTNELDSQQMFKGEFARKFGPKRRGVAFNLGRIDDGEDDPDFHAYHLSLEPRKPKRGRRGRPGK